MSMHNEHESWLVGAHVSDTSTLLLCLSLLSLWRDLTTGLLLGSEAVPLFLFFAPIIENLPQRNAVRFHTKFHKSIIKLFEALRRRRVCRLVLVLYSIANAIDFGEHFFEVI